ncbi:hypothetical protein F2Q69_00062787 [Brassica cretica]|uniref:PLAT domain-containing protein n=1 Tax=Brassica cretica TaxID=69181 RepID=A0A8S9RDT3_BRACR|nr:hypothetical protein F2Q69_00062787 [Brassica cretica]
MARHDIHLLFVLIATISAVALASVCPPNLIIIPILALFVSSSLDAAENCHYTISVKTGSRHDSGTDAVIGIVLADKSGKYIEIKNLVSWGGNMEPGRDYFENYYLDIFTGTEQCLPTTICFMTLNSDGSGHKPGWYAANVDVKTTKTGTPSKYQHFTVEQWLANSEPPYLLYAERDNCPSGIKKSPYSIQTCTYTINAQTGTRADSGTDAVIGIVLADQSEEYIEIKDLVNWGGKMPEGHDHGSATGTHDYFENGNLDIFSGTERCLPGPVCFMRLNSDNSGYKPGWYVVYVDVTTSKPGSVSKQQRFTVEQWLAVDEPPNQLYAERSNCPV